MAMLSRKYNRPRAWFSGSVALGLLGALTVVGCLEPPEYSVVPELTFRGLTRDTMVQGAIVSDSTSFTTLILGFTDGDGDIAFPADDTTTSVFVTNIKTGERLSSYKIRPIEEAGLENGISGEFRLRVFSTCCDYPPNIVANPCDISTEYPIDTLLLEAHILDRAGNESNRVAVAPIYLQCDRR